MHFLFFKREKLKPTGQKSIWTISLLCLILIFCSSFSAQASLVDKLKEHKTSLRCEDLKISLLLRAIGRQGGVNIFVADDIEETITLDIDGLTLYEAFQIILDAKKLSYTEKNNVLLVEKLSSTEKSLKNLRTTSLCTEYGNADTYVDQLKPLLSAQGKLTISQRGNCLIVQDLPAHIESIALMLAELDRPVPQVHIEAKIVTVTNEAKKRLGIRWDYNNLSTKNPLTGISDLTVTSATNVTLGFIRDNLDLSVDLQAMQEDNILKILSSPRILVLDGKEAEIKSGQEVPYVTQSGDNINTTFREANLSLKVTPKILKDNFVMLKVGVTNDSVDEQTVSGTGIASTTPLINRQEISTDLFLENNITVVIGGILLETIDNQSERVPFISKIPIIGWFFRNSQKSKERSELLVFLTPTIVDMGLNQGNKVEGGPIHLDEAAQSDMTQKDKTGAL